MALKIQKSNKFNYYALIDTPIHKTNGKIITILSRADILFIFKSIIKLIKIK